MYQGREQGKFLVESQVPTVVAGEKEHIRCPREKMGQENGGWGVSLFFSVHLILILLEY